MSTQPKQFSLEEANAMIPQLEICLKQLMEKKNAYASQHDALFMSELLAKVEHEAGKRDDPFPSDQEVQGFEASIEDFEKDLQPIRNLGCLLRSIDQGTVEFLGQWKGKQVYFNWKLGEEQIAFYRLTDRALSERTPLEE